MCAPLVAAASSLANVIRVYLNLAVSFSYFTAQTVPFNDAEGWKDALA